MSKGDHNSKAFLFGVLVGGALGLASGLLAAPQPGSRTREELARKGGKVALKLRDKGLSAREASEVAFKKARRQALESLRALKELVSEVKEMAGQAIAAGREERARKQQELEDAVEDAISKLEDEPEEPSCDQ